jgi:hypothetical protein
VNEAKVTANSFATNLETELKSVDHLKT